MERITTTDEVPEQGSFLFTVTESDGREEEVILIRDSEEEIAAWKNFCQHEIDQRLDRGNGAATRDGGVICPKHGSIFDGSTGYCDNGKAAGSTLAEVAITVNRDDVYLTDDDLTFEHVGGISDDDMPGSSSHLGF
ncbi:Rieske (2Fe-2S) protein [Halosegnis longus]|uniref:Rieske (2Fe-2S) protein n=1 Tax=Halosegnis longus TaxID=2216012 RepID=A0AAJ4R7E3_9EURY|nr:MULTISPECIES: Rieske (2Fe-2S) protein [Halobacteriales]RNJ25654.1 Rieske (2Fe-2S) protein [Salella cibi]